MRAIVDKVNLAKVIAENIVERERFIEWASRQHVTAADVLKWATEDDVQKACQLHNEIVSR